MAAIARKLVDQLKSKEFRDYLMRLVRMCSNSSNLWLTNIKQAYLFETYHVLVQIQLLTFQINKAKNCLSNPSTLAYEQFTFITKFSLIMSNPGIEARLLPAPPFQLCL